MKNFFFFLLILLSFSLVAAEGDGLTVVAVGKAQVDKEKVYFEEPNFQGTLNEREKKVASEITALFRNDFAFYQKRFHVLPPVASASAPGSLPRFDDWERKNVSYFANFTIEKKNNSIVYHFDGYSIKDRKNMVKREGILDLSNPRAIGHKLASDFYMSITGKEPIFGSRIVFVCDQSGNIKKPVKELYMMDFDGNGARRLTHHNSTVLSPGVSPDGKKIVYSLIKEEQGKVKNINLYLLDVVTGQSKMISNKTGINSGAVFLPDGENVAVTFSMGENADIYIMNLASGGLRKITNHFAIDVDPSLSADGKIMTFLSGRSGNAMIYTLDPSATEKDVKRISYVGQFNATPRFAPQANEIVFASWLDDCFDLFRINADGTGLVRLTKNFGSNEDPVYSNDGEFIVFTSQRVLSSTKAVQNLYIMDRDGEIMGSLTKNFGNCISPRWINPLK